MTRRPAPRAFPVLLTVALLAGVLILAACGGGRDGGGTYLCPMHPTYVSDKTGDCPICGMRLVKTGDRGPATAGRTPTHPETAGPAAYVCPMQCPNGTSGEPGDCPDCGMPLVKAAEPTATATPLPSPLSPLTGPRPPVAGMAAVEVTAAAVKLAGVQTVPAVAGRLSRSVRTVGTVVADETRVRRVHTKIAGWIEHLFVNFTGQEVRVGQPLLAIYSQELLASQEEFLRARNAAARFATSTLPEVRRGAEDLLQAARRRLELFDVPPSFIAELETAGEPQRLVTIFAKASGVVTGKNAFEGQQVEPGTELFTITDLSRVWVEAEFYEHDARWLSLGARAAVTLPYDPATLLDGRITYVYPTLDPATRTVRARLEFPNTNLALKPGMFVNVDVTTDRRPALLVPDSAVLDSGERQIVFVAFGPDRFEPREVRLGGRGAGQAEILSGLAEGEEVVIRANFLLDSESRLRAALSGPTPTPGTGVRGPGPGEAHHVH